MVAPAAGLVARAGHGQRLGHRHDGQSGKARDGLVLAAGEVQEAGRPDFATALPESDGALVRERADRVDWRVRGQGLGLHQALSAEPRTTGGEVTDNDRVLVAGAGPTGLGLAWGLARRGLRSIVVDPRPATGGLASSRRHQGTPYKAGIHLLHPSAEVYGPLVETLCEMMGDGLVRVRTRAAIHFLGRYLDYPFHSDQVVRALGAAGTARVSLGMLRARLEALASRTAEGTANDTFETVVRRAYGDPFYRLFFRDYTSKVLGLPADRIAGKWARRRVPMPTGRSVLQLFFPWWRPRRIEHAHNPSHRWQYTGAEGLDPLFDGLLAACEGRAELRLGTSLTAVELGPDGAVQAAILEDAAGLVDRLPVARVFSTMPLPSLVAALGAAVPRPVRQAAGALTFRGLVLVYLLVRRPRLFDAQWTYFQDPELAFNRVSEFTNVIQETYGPRRSLVCAEITAQPGDALWNAEDADLVERTVADLRRVTDGLGPGDGDPGGVEQAFVDREANGYPRWTVGFEEPLARVLSFVDGTPGLVTVGRQGRFDYLNIDECIDAGRRAADGAIRKAPRSSAR